MALTAGTIFQIQASATTGNTGGAGFNTANANFPTDLAATSANTASPVVTSATYTFVTSPSTDVGAWVYIKSGTNWTAGWYQIASVSGGAATLSAGIGAAILSIGSTGIVTYNASAGCATTASPTGGTFGVDYSQQDTTQQTHADLACTTPSTTVTSATAAFTPVSVGNIMHITAISGTGALTGWFEIVSYTNATTVVLDRTPAPTNNATSGTYFVGGAGRFNGLESSFQAMLPAGSIVWVKNGSYTLSGAFTGASTNGTATSSIYWLGYNSIRGDTCVGSNRPIFAFGSSANTLSQYHMWINIIITGTGTIMLTGGTGGFLRNCKVTNSSSTTTRVAATAFQWIIDCEIVSQNGVAVGNGGSFPVRLYGCYIHDSANGISITGSSLALFSNVFEANTTTAAGDSSSTGVCTVIGNTFYGREAKIGTGLSLSGANSPSNNVYNNIFYGLTTGISVGTGSATSNFGQTNDFFNNTTDVTNWIKDGTDVALDPTFAGASQLTGSTATTSGSVLTDSGASFGVTDNVDYLHVTSGTGVTVGCYLINSHTSTTLTVNNALGTSSGGDVVYWVTHGHNFQIGANLRGVGFPTFINSTGSNTTSYPDIGAVIPQSTSGTGGGSFTFVG